MTFDASIPLASDSPGIFPAQSQQNFQRLLALLGADHQFNLSAAATDGYHNLIHMTQQAPTGALSGIGRLYVKVVSGIVQLFYMDDAGTEYQVTPRDAAVGLFAAVNFNGVSGTAIRSSFNVTSVVRTGTGAYTINFTNPAPNNNYLVQATGMRNQDRASLGSVQGDATYGNSVQTGLVKVKFFGSTSDEQDVLMGNVMVYLI